MPNPVYVKRSKGERWCRILDEWGQVISDGKFTIFQYFQEKINILMIQLDINIDWI